MIRTSAAGAFAALRAFTQARPDTERCELCAVELAATHDHLLEVETRRLQCACAACSRLFGPTQASSRKLVRHRVQRLPADALTDEAWHALGLPIDLAFFVRSNGAERAVALYPSRGGPVQSSLPLPAWESLVSAHPIVAGLQPDVEALLVRRVGGRRDSYVVSIDECYRLVGLIRVHWRGFSGGPEVQTVLDAFFAELDRAGSA